ncbi:MAG: hypothetical protein A3D67_03425 [Candidatus Lloydbacteria bacterium RIFCSPHIGHO2_02_FULL_51_22]|uniref:Uncharacterized protein n=2 Tax=Candidatus Lloydiibacteriota TaxID=1817910 RepID=A0A1G2DCN3_9BACT|nr:MAG: hypothetical protein A3D67_03425 [Candidatus Lloydbacteria bacterium RIFCSPHIGHO2_02_FULL_51_22]OGZ14038.1 MAG: hypothetical protein A3J08_03870 [Candidatus Lloydbacteria bacterium RIFCSPLOWO2_02_FULL_51_11]
MDMTKTRRRIEDALRKTVDKETMGKIAGLLGIEIGVEEVEKTERQVRCVCQIIPDNVYRARRPDFPKKEGILFRILGSPYQQGGVGLVVDVAYAGSGDKNYFLNYLPLCASLSLFFTDGRGHHHHCCAR